MYPDSVNANVFLPILKLRLRDHYITLWNEKISLSSSLYVYREFSSGICMSSYLEKLDNKKKYRKALSKIRLSSHDLNIKTGRHRHIERSERKCLVCDTNDIEDEFHFILTCPLYENIRKVYIKMYFYRNPSMYKFIQLLKNENMTHLKNLAKYIIEAFKLREANLAK